MKIIRFILLSALIMLVVSAESISAETTTAHLSFYDASTNTRSTLVGCKVPSGYPTIQTAVNDVSCGEITLENGTFPDDLNVDRDVTIRGAGRANSKITSLITVDNDAILMLETLSITETGSNGISLNSDSAELIGDDIEISLTVWGITFGPLAQNSKVTLTGSSIYENSGGIFAKNIDLDDTVVSYNTVHGGVKVNSNGIIRNSAISNNEINGGANPTGDGAGILFEGVPSSGQTSGTLMIEDSIISANIALGPSTNTTADGGGIMVRKGRLEVTRSEIVANVAGRHGGGIASALPNLGGNVVVINDSTVSDNIAYGHGGGLYAGRFMSGSRNKIISNRALYFFSINTLSAALGGGVYVSESGNVSFRDTEVSLNFSKREFAIGTGSIGDGGGFYFASGSQGLLDSVTLHGNQTFGDGGGIYAGASSNLTLINLTIFNNTAFKDGGGIHADFPIVLKLSTVVGNTALKDGGGLSGVIATEFSLIAENIDQSIAPNNHPDCSGNIGSNGHSIIGKTDGCAFAQTPSDLAGTVVSPLNTFVSTTLTQQPGEHVPTLALLPGSPAIDGGWSNCTNITNEDARHLSRIAKDGNGDGGIDSDFCDIGAFEVQSTVPTNIALNALPSAAAPDNIVGWQLIATMSLFVFTLMTIHCHRERVKER